MFEVFLVWLSICKVGNYNFNCFDILTEKELFGTEIQLMSETAELIFRRLDDTSVGTEFACKEWLQFFHCYTVVTCAVANTVSHFVTKSIVFDNIHKAIGDGFACVALLERRKCN
jgi:hypothetical protein